MGKLTQKQLLEGLGTALRKGISATARGASAVGGALRQASAAGERATVGDFIQGGKAGYEAEKLRQTAARGDTLEQAVTDQGFIFKNVLKKDGDVYHIKVADSQWDETKSPPRETEVLLPTPLKLKWDNKNKTFSTLRPYPRLPTSPSLTGGTP